MKYLRLVTILVTWLLMLVTMFVPIGFFFFKEGFLWDTSLYAIFNLMITSVIMWFFYGSPLLVSGIISLFLKRPFCVLILLLSTIGYGIGAFYILHLASGDGSCMAGIEFLWVGPASLVFLIPVWIITLVFNFGGVNKTPALQETGDNPGTEVPSL